MAVSEIEIIWVVLLVLFGLAIGSFLNVVAKRLPIMSIVRWKKDAKLTLLEFATTDIESAPTLSTPRSNCSHCGHLLGAIELIPVLGYLLLKGRCKSCQQPISVHYPLIELISGAIVVLPLLLLPTIEQAFAASVAGWLLLVLSIIDLNYRWLLDSLTYPLLWIGLLVNCFTLYTDPANALLGAVTGYLSLWIIGFLFYAMTGKIGMGKGDFKLFACAGAWLGLTALPSVLLVATLSGLLFALVLALKSGWQKGRVIAFGPWIALGFWLHLLWHETLLSLLALP